MTTLPAKETITLACSKQIGSPTRPRRKVAASKKSTRVTATGRLLQDTATIDEWDLWQFERGESDAGAAGQRQEQEYVLLKQPVTVASAQRRARTIPREFTPLPAMVEVYSATYAECLLVDLSLAKANVSLRRLRKPATGVVPILCKMHAVFYLGLAALMALLIWALLAGMLG